MPKLAKPTKSTLERLELPEGKSQEDHFFNLFPGRSLVVGVNASSKKSGKKTFSVMFYDAGKPRRVKLGEFPTMSVAKAIAAANKFDVEGALAKAEAGSFKLVHDQFIARHVKAKGLRSEAEIVRLLRKYVLPKWEKKQFAEIDTADITDLMDEIFDRAPSQADAVRAVISKMMRWYEDRKGGRYRRPHVPGRRLAPVKRQRWLTDQEIVRVWDASQQMPLYGAMIRILLLTGMRLSKVVEMKWDDLNLETGEWRIPREPREKGTPPEITLPAMALEIIRQQDRVVGSPYVFHGRGKKLRFDSFSQRKEELDKLSGVTDWRIHDLRRTARKLMTRTKVPAYVAEAALGHVIKGVEGVYVDATEYRPEIDDALRRVAGEVARILNPESTVIALRG